MIWFVVSIILLLFSSAVTCVAMSNNVKGAGIGLIPGLVGLLLLIPACLIPWTWARSRSSATWAAAGRPFRRRGLPLEDAVAERHQIRHP